MDVCLDRNLSEHGKYNLISDSFNKILKTFLCVMDEWYVLFDTKRKYIFSWCFRVYENSSKFYAKIYTSKRDFSVEKTLTKKNVQKTVKKHFSVQKTLKKYMFSGVFRQVIPVKIPIFGKMWPYKNINEWRLFWVGCFRC